LSEEAAREAMKSESIYKLIFENVHDGVLLRDANTLQIMDVNPRFCELYQVSREEILSSRPGSFGTQGPLSGLKRLMSHFRMARDGKPQVFEWQVHRKDGSKLWVEINLREATIEDRTCFLSVVRDISDRKQIAQQLRESQDRFYSALESITDVFFIVDYQWVLRYTNREFERVTKKDRGMMVGQNLWETLPKMKGTVFYEKFLEAASDRRALTFEAQAAGKHWVEVGVYPSNAGLSIYLKDIMKKKEAEQARQQSEQRYRELVENANSIILRMDRAGRVLYFNEYAQKFFGFTEEEIIGKHVIGTIVPETDSSGQDLKKFIDAISRFPERYATNENENMRKDGERVWISWTNKTICNEDGELRELLCVGNDATDRKRLEERLRHAQKMEAMGTLAGGIAHDFNNILAVMIGNIELAGDDASEGTRHHLQQALNAGLRGRDTIRQILTFSRKGEQKTKVLHLIPLLREMVKMLRASLPTTIEISLNIVSDRDAVRADPTQIQQVIMNLCANSKDAMSPAGGLLEINLEERQLTSLPELGMRPGRYIVLKVHDTGEGIDETLKRRIFEPFFTTKEPGKGTGMGLALAYSIVRGINGSIEVGSEPGKGSVFTIYLPSVQHRTPSPTSSSSSELPLYRGSESILFVDDEENQVEIVKRTLEGLGYTVTALTNSTEALELFCRDPGGFDLVITDQMMPLMSGTTLAKHILSVRSDMPIIVVTGFSETVSPRTAHAHGIREFAMKPLVKRELAETIRRVLDQPVKAHL
jgi:PAS domain S-box-containing protein